LLRIGCSTVRYHEPRELGWGHLKAWLESAGIIYLNGFFGATFSLKVAAVRRTSARLRQIPLLIAPRGEVFPKALAIKAVKKRLGVAAVRVGGLYQDAAWHASTPLEEEPIRVIARRLGQRQPTIYSACDIAHAQLHEDEPPPRRVPRLIFLSRIHPKKNLDFALRVLARLKSPVRLDIIGPIEDAGHWRECRRLIDQVPAHHRVSYVGSLETAQVAPAMAAYDLFLLPTRSENFGHAIQEALAAGVPALISDQTPWRGLKQAGAGWDLPLDEAAFATALQEFCATSHEERLGMRRAARALSGRFGAQDAVEAHRQMFRELLEGTGRC
jgi:glycosyltransferase involved in cell wall biosynthesis